MTFYTVSKDVGDTIPNGVEYLLDVENNIMGLTEKEICDMFDMESLSEAPDKGLMIGDYPHPEFK